MPSTVVIVDYDPDWPVLYEKEKRQILEAVGDRILDIEHIGSTAVPDLGAKPIIDIMAGVRDKANADECLIPLQKIGYTDVTPEPDDPEWFYCLGKGPHSPGYHLHLMKYQSGHWNRHLDFRDYLRSHPDVAKKYFRLKKGLSKKYGTDRVGYTNAKTAFIRNIELTAQQQIISKQQ
jgi:GrpB-like predicted nucleotidyltransferase (UPF0157 family)